MSVPAEAGPDKAPRKRAAARKPDSDTMLADIDALCKALRPRLAEGLTVARDNPGRTPQQWSVKGADGKPVLSFGTIDRTFFWTWDESVSNHYAKNSATMARVITGELARFGHLR